jgi:excisionase family DNA binding protein
MGQVLEFPKWLSEKEAAAYLSVSLSTIRRWRRSRTGPDLCRFGGVLRYSKDALDAYILKNTLSAA